MLRASRRPTTTKGEIITTDAEKLRKIHDLLDEAYRHFYANDGAGKSQEGYIQVGYGNFFDRQDQDQDEPLRIRTVSIYSYGLGPHRMHDFDSLDEALAAVRSWHAEEMAHVSDAEDFDVPQLTELTSTEFVVLRDSLDQPDDMSGFHEALDKARREDGSR